MRLLPGPCQKCGSDRFIPIITGTPTQGGMLDQLSVLGLASPWGCMALGGGIPLWCCADCGQAYDVEGFRWCGGQSPAEQEYKRVVEELYGSFKPLDDAELNVYRGRGLLMGIVRSVFSKNTAEIHIIRTAGGFCVKNVDDDGSTASLESKYYTSDLYSIICAFADSFKHAGVALPVRIGRNNYALMLSDCRSDNPERITVVVQRKNGDNRSTSVQK